MCLEITPNTLWVIVRVTLPLVHWLAPWPNMMSADSILLRKRKVVIGDLLLWRSDGPSQCDSEWLIYLFSCLLIFCFYPYFIFIIKFRCPPFPSSTVHILRPFPQRETTCVPGAKKGKAKKTILPMKQHAFFSLCIILNVIFPGCFVLSTGNWKKNA